METIQVLNDQKEQVATLSKFKDRSITMTLSSGDKTMTFQYPVTDPQVDLLREEYYLCTKTDRYVLKQKEGGDQYNTYTATLDVEDLEGMVFPYGFESDEQTISKCLEFAFDGTGWHVGVCSIKKKRTIDIQESTTAWEVLQKALSTYRCECRINTMEKTVDIYEQIGSDKGAYFIEKLNLKKLTLKSDTYDFYTRIYPIGKDGITPRAVTGKDYIDNFQYSSKIKAVVWKDERYTNTTSLIEDATAKLDEMSKPLKAYTVNVIDLASASAKYSALTYDMGDTVTLVSKSKKVKEKQRIVKMTIYPEDRSKNTVEISNVNKSFAEVQKEATEVAKGEAIEVSNRSTKKILEDYATTEEVETKFTANQEEIIAEVRKKVGNDEIISRINQSAEEIQIQAGKINFKGKITVTDLADDSGIATKNDLEGFVDEETATQITKDTVTTQYVNTLKVEAGSVKAENIEGKAIHGIEFLTKQRTQLNEEVVGLYIGEDGLDFCWDASNEWSESALGHFRITSKALTIIVSGHTVLSCNADVRHYGSNIGEHVYVPTLMYDTLVNGKEP